MCRYLLCCLGIMLILGNHAAMGQDSGVVEKTVEFEKDKFLLDHDESRFKRFEMELVPFEETGLQEYMATEHFKLYSHPDGKKAYIFYRYMERLLGGEGPDQFRQGQYLSGMGYPRNAYRGLPKTQEGQVWYLEARIGNGTRNTYHMVVYMSDDRTELNWLVDMNQNLDFSDDIVVTQPKHFLWCSFPSLEFDIQIDGQPKTHSAHLYATFHTGCRFWLISDFCRKGKLVLNDETYEAILMDYNGNGMFNNVSLASYNLDRIYIRMPENKDEFLWCGSAHLVQTDEAWHYITPSADGSQITLTDTRPGLHPLKTDFEQVMLFLSVEGRGHFNFKSHDGTVFLPAGKYELAQYSGHFDHQGESWEITTALLMPPVPITVEPGDNFFSIRSTPEPHLTAKTLGDKVVFDEALRGALDDEQWFIDPSDKRWSHRTITIQDMEGNTIHQARFEAG